MNDSIFNRKVSLNFFEKWSGQTRPPYRSLHKGKHTHSTSVGIEREMSKIVTRGKKEGWTQRQYRDKLLKLIAKARKELRLGNVALNKNQREWSQKLSDIL